MGYLKEYMQQPHVMINGRIFVDRDVTLDYLAAGLEDVKKDTFSEEEKDGIDLCIKKISNMLCD